MIGSYPQVLNFNQLSLKLNQFIFNLVSARFSPLIGGGKYVHKPKLVSLVQFPSSFI